MLTSSPPIRVPGPESLARQGGHHGGASHTQGHGTGGIMGHDDLLRSAAVPVPLKKRASGPAGGSLPSAVRSCGSLDGPNSAPFVIALTGSVGFGSGSSGCAASAASAAAAVLRSSLGSDVCGSSRSVSRGAGQVSSRESQRRASLDLRAPACVAGFKVSSALPPSVRRPSGAAAVTSTASVATGGRQSTPFSAQSGLLSKSLSNTQLAGSPEIEGLSPLSDAAAGGSVYVTPGTVPSPGSHPLRKCSTDERLEDDEAMEEARGKHPVFRDALVARAYDLARSSHEGQRRKSGEHYIVHCVQTAVILAEMGAGPAVVAAALLHDVLDDTSTELIDVEEVCGEEVADMVELVTQMSSICEILRRREEPLTADELRDLKRMFTAMGSGPGVNAVVIKIADRLHNMRTLDALADSKQQRIARETLDVFAPLANRLGMWHVKAELEDLCFKYLHGADCRQLKAQLASMGTGNTTIGDAMRQLQALFRSMQLDAEITGRPKNLYSIHRKIVEKGRSLEDIHDLFAIRVVVADVRECYEVLNTVHRLWEHVPGRFKDYIKEPKESGYKSLHTVVRLGDLRMEVQIRTHQMHLSAEYGVAAHWQYKEGQEDVDEIVRQQVRWMRYMLSWSREAEDALVHLEHHEDVASASSPGGPDDGQLASSGHGAAGLVCGSHDHPLMCKFPTHLSDCRYAKLSMTSGVSAATSKSGENDREAELADQFSVGPGPVPGPSNIVVVTSDGRIQSLPINTQLVDLVSSTKFQLGCAVQVNGQPVGPDYLLNTGDLIEVMGAA